MTRCYDKNTKKKMTKWHEGGFNVSSFRTPLNQTNVSNICFTKPIRTFICCPRIYFFFENI